MHTRTILPPGAPAATIHLCICFGGYHLHALKRLPLPRPPLLVAEIQRVVCDHYELPLRVMSAAGRAREMAWPRQVAMFLCRELTGRSLPDIGRRFGGRDHSTVLHALRAVEKRRREDPELDADLRRLRARLEGRG
jgi:chromosomal replication initiation ATPase DnaA